MKRERRDPMLPHPYRVRRVRRETADTCTLELQAAGEPGIAEFAPGQFNMLYAFGVGEVPISISGNPARRDNLVHTVRAVGAVTRAICRSKPGQHLGVRGPFGAPWPVAEAIQKDILIVAGGLGMAPLRPLLYALLANRDGYGKVALIYGARTPADLLYRSELDAWRGHTRLQTEVTVGSAGSDWRGNVGVVTSLIPQVRFDPAHTVAMLCGPEVMMRFSAMELLNRGVAAENIFISMERNMQCGIGFCGHCQFGPYFVCRDGPVFSYDRVKELLVRREV